MTTAPGTDARITALLRRDQRPAGKDNEMTETVTVSKDDLRLLMAHAADATNVLAGEVLHEALARCGEALNGTGDSGNNTESPLPEGLFGRVELPGYRQHTGWITEETRFGVQMAVIRDWDGREMAAAVIGANSQVVYLPTPRKRPDPVAIAAAIEASGDLDDGFYEPGDDDDGEDPFR